MEGSRIIKCSKGAGAKHKYSDYNSTLGTLEVQLLDVHLTIHTNLHIMKNLIPSILIFLWGSVLTWDTVRWNVTLWAEIMNGNNVSVGIVGKGYPQGSEGASNETGDGSDKNSHIKSGDSPVTYNVTPIDVQFVGSWTNASNVTQCHPKKIKKPVELKWFIFTLSNVADNYTNTPLNVTVLGRRHGHRCLSCYLIPPTQVFICVQGKVTATSSPEIPNLQIHLEEVVAFSHRGTEVLKSLELGHHGTHSTSFVPDDERQGYTSSRTPTNGAPKDQEKTQKSQKEHLSRSRERRESVRFADEGEHPRDAPASNGSPETPLSIVSTHANLYTGGPKVYGIRQRGNPLPSADAPRAIPDHRGTRLGLQLRNLDESAPSISTTDTGGFTTVRTSEWLSTPPDHPDGNSTAPIMLSPPTGGTTLSRDGSAPPTLATEDEPQPHPTDSQHTERIRGRTSGLEADDNTDDRPSMYPSHGTSPRGVDASQRAKRRTPTRVFVTPPHIVVTYPPDGPGKYVRRRKKRKATPTISSETPPTARPTGPEGSSPTTGTERNTDYSQSLYPLRTSTTEGIDVTTVRAPEPTSGISQGHPHTSTPSPPGEENPAHDVETAAYPTTETHFAVSTLEVIALLDEGGNAGRERTPPPSIPMTPVATQPDGATRGWVVTRLIPILIVVVCVALLFVWATSRIYTALAHRLRYTYLN